MTTRQERIEGKMGVIGSGQMAQAIISGLIDSKMMEARNILAAGPRKSRGEELEKEFGVRWSTKNQDAVSGSSIVLLCVKPQMAMEVLGELEGKFAKDCVLISILAGFPIARMTALTGHDKIVRVMPNTPSRVLMGMSVWTCTSSVTKSQKRQTQLILQCVGREQEVVHESSLDLATAVSGTGPAYLFLMVEAWIDAAVQLGFSRRLAQELVLQTISGSVEYLRRSNVHPAILRNQVTSPGGTTAHALAAMEAGGFRTILTAGIKAAYERSVNLGKAKAKL
eukprot:TRINITY_DN3282_c0_g1_i1.p1 TRINITY_DN3282_c0_g1~~TRINITY_DN3282_c0_g1_i1.p1  ORF type:complete len:289 (-),score=76.38 TRINITY_DN3282_c0_g1_i1:179-1021(-)